MTHPAKGPMSDIVARFWHLLSTETVALVVQAQHPRGPMLTPRMDISQFSNEVAKALVAERQTRAKEEELADSYAVSVCDDPECGIHMVALRADDTPICEIVITRDQIKSLILFAFMHGMLGDMPFLDGKPTLQ